MYKSYDEKFVESAKAIYYNGGSCEGIECVNCFTGNMNTISGKRCVDLGNCNGTSAVWNKDEITAKAAEDFLLEAKVEFKPRVYKLYIDDFRVIASKRAEWGHIKYGDADKYRDTAIDVVEELADINNIIKRRLMHMELEGLSSKILISKANEINAYVSDLFVLIKDFDKILYNIEYPVTDRNGGPRVAHELFFKK